MEHGRIIERGTHIQLLDARGRYAEMWRLQQSGGDLPENRKDRVDGNQMA